ncbi:MAG TPA: glucose-1-phosphate adenylyltransferase subunit GlgD [Desulfosporosinus sp.]|nr:glucose-1-phosphate adenylyltransferase subunit GlgD [Desulfosporosinus sp.]
MPNAIGIIYANSSTDNLQGLALRRPIAAIPFGGRYRILDFALSSMVNSGIRTIGVVTSQPYRTILDHLGAGKAWFLDRKDGGLFILPGVMHSLAGDGHTFCVKDLRENLHYLQKDFADNVIISHGDQIYNMDFKDALNAHNDTNAEVTLIYKECHTLGDPIHERVIKMNEGEKVSGILDKKVSDSGTLVQPHFTNMLIIRRQLLVDIVEQYGSFGCRDLVDIVASNLEVLRVYGWPTCSVIGTIRTVKDYFDRSMDLLGWEVREKLWLGENQIHTIIVDNPPTRYTSQAKVSHSLIASGCYIAGEVVNSIIFRGVIVEQGCKIEDSIILPKCHIHALAKTCYAILDKSVSVNAENVFRGSLNHPLVVLNTAVS